MPDSPEVVMTRQLLKQFLIFPKGLVGGHISSDLHVDGGHFLSHLASDQER